MTFPLIRGIWDLMSHPWYLGLDVWTDLGPLKNNKADVLDAFQTCFSIRLTRVAFNWKY